MRVAVGADHAGLTLKVSVVRWLTERGITHVDVGAHTFDPGDDYPDYVRAVAESLLRGESDLGIVICGTGQGSCIAANKIAGIRGAAPGETYSARCSRLHNDANVLCLGGRALGEGLALEIVQAWLETPFSGEERHQRRLAKIARLEQEGLAKTAGLEQQESC